MGCALQGCKNKARRRFCSNKHKDLFHNLNNPRGKFAHLSEKSFEIEDPNYHPFSSEALPPPPPKTKER